VAAALGGEPALLDTAEFPWSERWTLEPDGLRAAGVLLPWPRSIYVRGLACHPLIPSLSETLQEHPRRVITAMEEKRAFLQSLLFMARAAGAVLVNSPEANAQHSNKPWQLHLLRNAGLPTPETLVSNDRVAVRLWARGRRAVYKPLCGGATVQPLDEAALTDARMEQLDSAPVLFQERMDGLSVRVFTVAQEVVAAAEMHSEYLDYRQGEGAVVPAELSREESELALAAARATGMPFCGVDLIRGASGTMLLECNPSPMFAVFEDKTGLEVAQPLAKFLGDVSRVSR